MPMNNLPRQFLAQADAARLPLADASVDLVFTSPPYSDARTYSHKGISRKSEAWVEWMLEVVSELTRVCRGLVLVNCAGVTRDRVYNPAPEGLCWEWYKRGGNLWRPAYWHRVGIPGSGGRQWLRADVEYVLAFKRDAEWLPWADNTANGHPPKWAPGGEMSHRISSGARVNQWGHSIDSGGTAGAIDDVTSGGKRPSHVLADPKPSGRNQWGMNKSTTTRRTDGTMQSSVRPSHFVPGPKPMYRRGQTGDRQNAASSKLHTKSLADGTDEVQCYIPPVLANPGCLVRGIKVGGGLMGHPLAHENEAPFPVALAAWFIRSWCPPGGTVLDPFDGSGTTCDAAWREGRIGIGMDLRMSQCVLASRRLASPYATKTKAVKVSKDAGLFAEVA